MSNIFSNHAPTGQSEKTIVSSNPYSDDGRNIGYPDKFSVYVSKIDQQDGALSITETRAVSDLKGNKLYLYHRPMVNANGDITSISSSDGTINTLLTSATQGYIVFSSLPASTFTVTYIASPDSLSMHYFNNIQNDIMEMQKQMGVNNTTGYPGLKNLAYGLFDTPLDPNIATFAQRAVYWSHLDRDIVIGSTTESSLTGTYGVSHNIQLGTNSDTVTANVTGFNVVNQNGSKNIVVHLTNKTGDLVYISGSVFTEFPVTIGGPSYPGYSGSLGSISGSYYSGCALRVRGDAVVLGDLQTVGSIVVVNTTGEVSSIIGDFQVTDELSVYGQSYFYGLLNANNAYVSETLTIAGNIVAGNINGAGGNGQSLVDGLDASEIAHTYNTVIGKVLPHSVINGRPYLNQYSPINSVNTIFGNLNYDYLVGDVWTWSGFATATAGPSGVHPNIIQLNLTSNPLPKSGQLNGVWSEGLMDPGELYVYDVNTRFTSPVYGYTIESGDSTHIYKLNLFCPVLTSPDRVQTNDTLLIYNPYSRPYNYLTFNGGSSVTCDIFASSTYPLEIAFDNEVRKSTSEHSISVTSALNASVTGLTLPATGCAYVIANCYSDPEAPPNYTARSVPYTLDKETVIGEVVALKSGSTWSILDSTSYRPGNRYDSSWITIHNTATGVSGRAVPGFQSGPKTYFFNHNLGNVDILSTSIDLYLGTASTTGAYSLAWDQAATSAHSILSHSRRSPFGFDGEFTRIPLTNTKLNSADTERDASLCYFDSRLIGIQFNPSVINHPSGSDTFEYMRLSIRRDS